MKPSVIVRPAVWRCEHSHSGVDHPQCWERFTNSLNNGKVGYLDIESTQLKADFGIMLSWAIKTRGKDEMFSESISGEDLTTWLPDKKRYKFDYEIVKHLVEKMKEYEWIVTYYGTGFDLKFIRTRALYWGLDFPIYGVVKHKDVYYMVRGRLLLHSNRLESVCEFFGIKGKTPLKGSTWVNALAGDEKALAYINLHNRKDVEILEKVHNLIEAYVSTTRRSI